MTKLETVNLATPGPGLQRFLRTWGMQLNFLAQLVSGMLEVRNSVHLHVVSVQIPSEIQIFEEGFFFRHTGFAVVVCEPVFN